jgi:hypothetical protein
MSSSKKVFLSFASVIAISSMASCLSNNVPGGTNLKAGAQGDLSITRIVSDSVSAEHVFVDVGNGKVGANFDVKLNFGPAFNTKVAAVTSNTNGFSGTGAGVKSIRLWLLDVDSTTVATANSNGTTSLQGFSKGTFLYANTTATPVITFSNVPASTNAYYVGVAAYSDLTGTIPNDVTSNSASVSNRVQLGPTAHTAAISNSGGDGSGSITVSSLLQVSSTTGLAVPAQLVDIIGAKIGADVTFTSGGTTLASPSGAGTN